MAVASNAAMNGTSAAQRDVKALGDEPTISTQSAEEVESPNAVSSGIVFSSSSDTGSQPTKGILDNAHEVPRRTSRASSGSSSGFKAALKAAFLPPPAAGKQVKIPEGKQLGKTFKRSDPLPDGGRTFEGGEVLDFDPCGENAAVGDGVLPTEALKVPSPGHRRRQQSVSDSGYTSDYGSSVGSEALDAASMYSVSEAGSSPSNSSMPRSDGRGRTLDTHPGRHRQSSIASSITSNSSSSAAIRFCPLPVTGRLKRANSITIGVVARAQLLQSQGTAAPPRQNYAPQHVHGSQAWYNDPQHPDVIDVGEQIRKGALKAWKKIRGGNGKGDSNSSDAATAGVAAVGTNGAPKKHYPKEGAPVADPTTGSLKVVGGPGVDEPEPRLSSLKEDPEHQLKGDQTPKRAASPDLHMEQLSIVDQKPGSGGGDTLTADPPAATAVAAQSEATATSDDAKVPSPKEQPNGHHPHEMEDGPQHDSYHLAEHHDGLHDDGMATPRSNMHRRSSTGAFLHGLSLAGIQEARRRQFLGIDDEGGDDHGEKADAAASSSGYEVRGPSGKMERVGLAGYGHYCTASLRQLVEKDSWDG